MPENVIRLLGGDIETLESRINEKIEAAEKAGYELIDYRLTEWKDRDRSQTVCSLHFRKRSTTKERRKRPDKKTEIVAEPTEIEVTLMQAKNARKLTQEQRDLIVKSEITERDASNILRFYSENRKKPKDERARMGQKVRFDQLINQLVSQANLANEWVGSRAVDASIVEPTWDWRAIRDEIATVDPELKNKEWSEIRENERKRIIRLRRR